LLPAFFYLVDAVDDNGRPRFSAKETKRLLPPYEVKRRQKVKNANLWKEREFRIEQRKVLSRDNPSIAALSLNASKYLPPAIPRRDLHVELDTESLDAETMALDNENQERFEDMFDLMILSTEVPVIGEDDGVVQEFGGVDKDRYIRMREKRRGLRA
jgi:hypothetical protein